MQIKRMKRALKDYTRAIELDPNSVNAYNYRGIAYYRMHDYPRAVKDFTEAVRIDPRYAIAYNNRGLAYL